MADDRDFDIAYARLAEHSGNFADVSDLSDLLLPVTERSVRSDRH